MNALQKIVHQTRNTGNTTWILESAIDRPNCIIIGRDWHQVGNLKVMYNRLLKKRPWHQRLKWKIFGRKHPTFLTVTSNIQGYRNPVIFDNGSFC